MAIRQQRVAGRRFRPGVGQRNQAEWRTCGAEVLRTLQPAGGDDALNAGSGHPSSSNCSGLILAGSAVANAPELSLGSAATKPRKLGMEQCSVSMPAVSAAAISGGVQRAGQQTIGD